MCRALQELNVGGVRTSAPAALSVLEDERFRKGDFDTHFLETLDLDRQDAERDELVAAAAVIYRHRLAVRRALATHGAGRDAWLDRGRRSLSLHVARAAQREGGAP